METTKADQHGAGPLPKGKSKPGAPLFKKPKTKEEKKERDLTGQTDTSLKHMKQRLAEVPKKSSGNTHDKNAYDENKE
ncbi:MAG: hypothetical protein WDN75_17050 [Bacteroidota bacterium]